MQKFKTIKDLTYCISEDMNVYPTDTQPEITDVKKIIPDAVNIKNVSLGTHISTHIDAPRHELEEGKSLDSYPAGKFVNGCLFIDLSDEKPFKKIVEKSNIEKYDLSGVKAIVIRTGYDEVIQNGKVDFNFPVISEQAALFISEHEINIVGIDSMSIDPKEKKLAHMALLKKEILIMESLVNLKDLPERFLLICLPLLIKDSDGSPCRAIALF